MGTNYYVEQQKCETCGHQPNDIHLGKSSGGWQFSFQYNGGQYYKNIKEMKAWLKDKTITDEYGAKVTPKQFWDLVKRKQVPENSNHAELYPEAGREMVIDGYSFSDVEFS